MAWLLAAVLLPLLLLLLFLRWLYKDSRRTHTATNHKSLSLSFSFPLSLSLLRLLSLPNESATQHPKKEGTEHQADLDSYASCRPGVTKCQTLDFPSPAYIQYNFMRVSCRRQSVNCQMRRVVATRQGRRQVWAGPDWTCCRDDWKLDASDNDVVFIFKMSARLAIG